MSRRWDYFPSYKWENWSTERLSTLLEIPWAKICRTRIRTLHFLTLKPVLPLLEPVASHFAFLPHFLSLLVFEVGKRSVTASSHLLCQATSPTICQIPEEHTSLKRSRDRLLQWRNSVTIYIQFTTISFCPSPDLMCSNSEWWTKLLNHFSVLFPFEEKDGAERKEDKGNLKLLHGPRVTQPWPHFLPVISLQSNCFLLWRHFRDSETDAFVTGHTEYQKT